MLTFVRRSVLESDAQTVVNTVNTDGVMGKGIAAEFKKRDPQMYSQYRELCRTGRFKVGQLWLWKGSRQWILNFPTKTTWRRPSEVSYVEAGLRKFVDSYNDRGISEIAFPRLGCGHGGLDWESQVRPLMEHFLNPLPIPVYVHDHQVDIGQPEHQARGDARPFNRTYEAFLEALRDVTSSRQGHFSTVAHGSSFFARLRDGKHLEIRRSPSGDAVRVIDERELLDVWAMLLKGPVTKQQLAGVARSEAYYLFGVISSLPFVRPVALQRDHGAQRIAIELLEKDSAVERVSIRGQTSLPWA